MAVYFLIPKSDGTEEILSRRARSLHETELEIDVHEIKTLQIREDVHEVQSNTEIITQGGTNSNSTTLCYSGTDFMIFFMGPVYSGRSSLKVDGPDRGGVKQDSAKVRK